MSLASFTIGGITAYIEENEDREGVYVHLEAGRKWGTLHCVEATGEWSSGDEEVSARELQTLEKIREKAEQIMDANGWEE